ncbi:MAG: 4'-phosphopantetheinyl transferase superfamily protein [Bacilli bacterium]|jgi:holo-[acyl-carrier protein] synthase|nr:4'-phosphopantetheinyl transferase superfamily protein [Bacilli bacterium]
MKGIGIDIVSVSRLSDKVADKILSKKEMAEFNSYLKTDRERAMEFLGGRLAAKEAYLKAIGVSTYEGILLPDLSIYKDSTGVPKFRGIPNARLTVSHDAGVAVAVVVIE